ncbi:MAG TPA: hypothetical protein VGK89_01965 [Candidatus Eisenbacteria bacterium]|jgi:hypothetical protein
MYVIRETFTAKPGMASKLAAKFKEVMAGEKNAKVRILTDAVGTFNTVVMETEVRELGEYEQRMKEYSERKDMGERMKGYTEMYQSGKREIYKVI